MAPGAQALAHYFAGQIQAGAAAAGAPQPTPAVANPGFGAGPQGPVALGNSPFIRSCVQCNSFHWTCPTLVGVDPQGPVAGGVSVALRSCIWCVKSVHFDCTLLANVPQGPVGFIGNSQFIRSCVDPNCFRSHLICTM
jgi:hypothetical protein